MQWRSQKNAKPEGTQHCLLSTSHFHACVLKKSNWPPKMREASVALAASRWPPGQQCQQPPGDRQRSRVWGPPQSCRAPWWGQLAEFNQAPAHSAHPGNTCSSGRRRERPPVWHLELLSSGVRGRRSVPSRSGSCEVWRNVNHRRFRGDLCRRHEHPLAPPEPSALSERKDGK